MSTTKREMPAGAALSPFDAADYLHSPQDVAIFLEAVLEDYDGDSRVIVKALGVAARALGMQKIAKETGLNREGLYQALSGKGNPSFDTVLKVMHAIGVELRPKVLQRRPADDRRKAKPGRKRLQTRQPAAKKRSQSSSTKARRSR
ncbi:MAG: addiction module antidote protein [Parvibaculaceae bacterium]